MPQQLRYQGYWYDNQVGWYWLGTRYYDPTLGRFLQSDRSGKEGVYSYTYCNNDPVDCTDPQGSAGTSGAVLFSPQSQVRGTAVPSTAVGVTLPSGYPRTGRQPLAPAHPPRTRRRGRRHSSDPQVEPSYQEP